MKSQIEVVTLTSDGAHRDIIKNFCAKPEGKGLEQFLKELAWDEDERGSTKVYLVKEKTTGSIVFFFALKAGLLYKEIGSEDLKLNETESEIFDYCIKDGMQEKPDYSVDEVLGWYESDDSIDKDKLRQLIYNRLEIKQAAKADERDTDREVHSIKVEETYPGIVLTHFCRNEECNFFKTLLFPLGFYIFWEVVVAKVYEISNMLGAQYLYLFAADATPVENDMRSDFLYGDFDEECAPNYKLVDYYKNELKFEEIQNITIVKPYYDYSCFSLIQPINKLESNRNAAWIQHQDIRS